MTNVAPVAGDIAAADGAVGLERRQDRDRGEACEPKTPENAAELKNDMTNAADPPTSTEMT